MDMTAQHLIVLALVAGCSIYALWALMPAAARRFIAKQLVQLPLGSAWKAWFQPAASTSSGCDCSGCDKVVDLRRAPSQKIVHFQARPRD
jgi:hypothetical protein